ncbi:MAG: TIGR01906 family membrane protein [Burkholderiales bacterium]
MKPFFTGVCAVLGSAMLIVALLIVSIEMFALNPGFYESEYKKLDTAQSIGMSDDDLKVVTKNFIDYVTGARENLDMRAEIHGQQREVFIDKTERDHMVDVKALYLGARGVRTISFIGAAVFIILAFVLGGKYAVKRLCTSFLRVSGVFVILVAALGIYAAADFTSFWTTFHRVFFTNDLWILDPSKSILIQMVPEQFFSDLVTRIIIRFVSIFAALNIAAAFGSYIISKNDSKKAAGA